MAKEFVVEKVSHETKDFTGKFGQMRSYRIKLRDIQQPVELVQKVDTPPPKELDTLYGDIDMSGSFGPRFKKAQKQEGGASFRGSKPRDEYSMYLSYSKDIVVALEQASGYNDKHFDELLEAVKHGADILYENRPEVKAEKQQETDRKNVDSVFDVPNEPFTQDSFPDDF